MKAIRRFFAGLFYRPEQWAVLLFGVVCVAFSAPMTRWSPWLASIMAGVGSSIFAAGITVRVLARLPREGAEVSLSQTGIEFLGRRDEFKSSFGNGQRNGWDHWIESAPRNAGLIICGKKNGFWLSESWDHLKAVCKRGVSVEFVFMGTDSEIATNYKFFLEQSSEARKEFEAGASDIRCFKFVSDSQVEDCGFYWNGLTLLVKVYLPHVSNEQCPILMFNAPGCQGKFVSEAFEDVQGSLALSRPQTIRACAQSLGHIIAQRKPI